MVWKGWNKVGTQPMAAGQTILALFLGENGEKLAYGLKKVTKRGQKGSNMIN